MSRNPRGERGSSGDGSPGLMMAANPINERRDEMTKSELAAAIEAARQEGIREGKAMRPKRARKSTAEPLDGHTVEDFFDDKGPKVRNPKKRYKFFSGWDAKLAALCRRIEEGVASEDEERLLRDFASDTSEAVQAKVWGSHYLAPLVRAAAEIVGVPEEGVEEATQE